MGRWSAALTGARTRRDPRLSVVVPVHNVEEYVAECLDSILGQSFDDLEVVVVDDGGSDQSATIVERYAEADPRLRVIKQENAGLGAARNVGVAAARGDFLAFVDSDDIVPPGAFENMMETLDRTGSDMVVGCMRQLVDGRTRVGPLMRENHAHRRESVAIVDMPLMLADVFSTNKIYRRSFWDRAGLAFPTALRYEDQPVLTAAFLAADRFDVVPETVYLWRRRRDKTSITQLRHELDDLRDRVVSKRMSTQAVVASDPRLVDVWYRRILPVDMWEYFRASTTGSDEYWATLRSVTAEFWNDATVPFVETRLPVQQRLMGWLVLQDRRAELAELIGWLDSRSGDLPVEVRGQEVVCLFPGVDDGTLGAPAAACTLAPHELAWRARVTQLRWSGSTLLLHGFALVQNLPARGRETALTGELVGPDGVTMPVDIRPATEPRATELFGRAGQNYDDCGFDAEIDVQQLAEACPGEPGVSVRWALSIERTVSTLRRAGKVNADKAVTPGAGWQAVSPDRQARVVTSQGRLCVEVAATPVTDGAPRRRHAR